MMHHSCLCDSAKILMPAKPDFQVVGENGFGLSVFKVFLIFDTRYFFYKQLLFWS